MSTELQTRPTVIMSLQLNTLPDIQAFCKVISQTDMVPKAYKGKPDDIMVAGLQGQKLGFDLFQSMQSIATINGVPSLYGDAGLSLVRGSGKLEDIDEWLEVDGERQVGSSFPIMQWADAGKKIVAFCMSKRVGAKRPRITTYSVDDAKRANLWEKKSRDGVPSPWCTTPQRMLMFRARSWNLRDEFGDVLKGLGFVEESIDIDTTPGADGTYRPVVATVEPEEDQAALAEIQAKLKAQREPVQGDGLAPSKEATGVTPPMGLAQQGQDAPAPKPAEAPALVDPFKGKAVTPFGPGKVEQPEWEEAIRQMRSMPDWNTLIEDWRADRKVKDASKLSPAGQQNLLVYMREKIGPAFPY